MYVPNAQGVQAKPLEAFAIVFCAQSAHLLLPSLLVNVPGAQGVHALRPVAFAYVPGAQAVHSVRAVALVYVPTAQPTHSLLPILALYLPSVHARQGPSFGPVYPALHRCSFS